MNKENIVFLAFNTFILVSFPLIEITLDFFNLVRSFAIIFLIMFYTSLNLEMNFQFRRQDRVTQI